jgi:hypothetical protein
MPGPAPNPNARRRNARPGFLILPAEGYTGEIPAWPLSRATQAEQLTWAALWRTPQAAAWEHLCLARTVARYVRALVKAERPAAKAFLLSEVRQLEDRLGLTPMSMLRLRWEVASDETAEWREGHTGESRWAGLKVVDGDAKG